VISAIEHIKVGYSAPLYCPGCGGQLEYVTRPEPPAMTRVAVCRPCKGAMEVQPLSARIVPFEPYADPRH
jgi:hypothetical protein